MKWDKEVRQFFSTSKDQRDRAIFCVAYRHGPRASEVDMLQQTDLNFKAGIADILSGQYPLHQGQNSQSAGAASFILKKGVLCLPDFWEVYSAIKYGSREVQIRTSIF